MITRVFEKKWLKYLFLYTLLGLYLIFALFPFYWAFITSIKKNRELYDPKYMPLLIKTGVTFEHYVELIQTTNFVTFFKNSAIVATLATFISVSVSIFAGYAITRIGFTGSEAFGTGVFLTYLVPPTLLFIPLFQLLTLFGVINTKWALVIVYPTLAVPFCTWLLIGYFDTIPQSVEDAALIDGANRWQVIWKIFLPLAKPGLIAATMFAFIVSWANYLYPVAFVTTASEQVLTAGAATELIKGDVFFWGQLMAAVLIAAIPIVIIFSFLMDYYVAGLTSGSTKG